MLLELTAQNIALCEKSQIDFTKGLSCITGETGAGKSLTLDALGLTLGGRADPALIKDGQDKAEAAALFSINDEMKQRLKELDLSAENEDELILRRVISRDGRNKAYVNGHLSTITMLKELAAALVSIHGQHASYKLLQSSYQLSLIDRYGGHTELLEKLRSQYLVYQKLRSNLNELSEAQKAGALRYKTLRYEKELLSKLNLKQGDYEDLVERFDKSMHAQKLMDSVALAQACLDSDEHNVIEILSQRMTDLEKCSQYDVRLKDIAVIFSEAMQSLESARQELAALNDSLTVEDPTELNDRLSQCHDLARRFGVEPRELYAVQERVENELSEFLSLRERIEAAAVEVKAVRAQYEETALALSQVRAEAAAKLSTEVTRLIQSLAMPDGRFEIKLWSEEGVKPRLQGRDETAFLFSANLGHELKDLASAASGGELSRLALALEAVTASAKSTPTIIFDEVDTGISGRTASAVGHLLQKLSQRVQVITVTHLPQVAACADTQYLAQKTMQGSEVTSTICRLDREGRVEELSRMMGGAVVTDATREGARMLLEQSSSAAADAALDGA